MCVFVCVSIDFLQIDQQARQHRVVITPDTNTVIVYVYRYVRSDREMEVENIIPRPLSSDCKEEQRVFAQVFKEQVIDLIKQFRRHFPYRQKIEWTIEHGNDNEHEHTLHIVVKSHLD